VALEQPLPQVSEATVRPIAPISPTSPESPTAHQ
jgi:hypothetical protein